MLVRIGRYLKGTLEQGLILQPSEALTLDCYPDANFAGLWGHENPDDPHCVHSRTGYVITLSNCPILWTSKMQTSITSSTMESEYIAMSQACKDLFHIMDLINNLTTTLDIPTFDSTNLHVMIHEDNVSVLKLGQLEPCRVTPRSKH